MYLLFYLWMLVHQPQPVYYYPYANTPTYTQPPPTYSTVYGLVPFNTGNVSYGPPVVVFPPCQVVRPGLTVCP